MKTKVIFICFISFLISLVIISIAMVTACIFTSQLEPHLSRRNNPPWHSSFPHISQIALPIHECVSENPTTRGYGGWNMTYVAHFQVCRICGQTMSVANHNFISNTCTVCGYTRTCTHSYIWQYASAAKHKQVCELCSAVMIVETHTFSENVCTKCGYPKVCLLHNSAWVYLSTAQHKEVCKLCYATLTTELHTFSNDTCTMCAYKKT